MIAVVEQNRAKIAEICRRHGVRKLDVFGSAARGTDFLSGSSDIDLFYEFDADPALLADRFFSLAEELENLLGHKVDLVSSQDARNPYFLDVANRDRVVLYAA